MTRPGIRKFPLRDEKPKPRLGPTVPSGLPAITVTMHETDISRSVTVPSLDFAFLDEYAAADSDSSEKGTKARARDGPSRSRSLGKGGRHGDGGPLWALTAARAFGRLRGVCQCRKEWDGRGRKAEEDV